MKLSRSAISSAAPLRAGVMTWQLAQVFWVGGLWVMHFVLLKALEKVGLASLLIQEVALYMRPLLVGIALVCIILQLWVLRLIMPLKQVLKDTRGQLLLASAALACSFFITLNIWPNAQYWLVYSYLALAMCGLLLVIQPLPWQRSVMR